MLVIVEFQDSELLDNDTSIENYEKYYKEKGFLYNEEAEAIYYEVEIPFMPIEGQRLGTKFGICIVDYSIYQTDTTMNHYFDRTKIVVRHE